MAADYSNFLNHFKEIDADKIDIAEDNSVDMTKTDFTAYKFTCAMCGNKNNLLSYRSKIICYKCLEEIATSFE